MSIEFGNFEKEHAATLERIASERRKEMVNLLHDLHQRLEGQRDKWADWRLARELEDRLGANQHLKGDIQKAEMLLDQYGGGK